MLKEYDIKKLNPRPNPYAKAMKRDQISANQHERSNSLVRWIIRMILLLFYSAPYVFFSIYGDARWRSLWLYVVMVASFTALAIIAHLTKNEVVVIVGNALSVISSFVALEISGIGAMSWYFKPVTTHIMIVFLSFIAIGAQYPSAIASIVKRRKQTIVQE